MSQENTIKKTHIEDVFNKIIEKERGVIEIKKMMYHLDYDRSEEMIDYILNEQIENYELYFDKPVQLLVNVLVEEDYFKEKLIKVLHKEKIISQHVNILLINKLKIENKTDFFKILDKISSMNFFLLNYEKFDYNEEEKNFLKSFLKLKTKGLKNYILDLDKNQLEKIKEKIGVFKELLFFDLYQKKHKHFHDKFIFFVDNFKYLDNKEENLLFLSEIFFIKIHFNIDRLDKVNYINFFKVHADYLDSFYNYLKIITEEARIHNNEKLLLKMEKILYFTQELLINSKSKI